MIIFNTNSPSITNRLIFACTPIGSNMRCINELPIERKLSLPRKVNLSAQQVTNILITADGPLIEEYTFFYFFMCLCIQRLVITTSLMIAASIAGPKAFAKILY
ncbi:unnamed protein product [Cuscuta epithymum]|uniref:Uncharacterized protein n=1 Tax=Cuscuta epithymum TaxID=186058 RepID=A0AAV0FY39_9ASTE|nr:unnamed protein product [Cuscuta epithymum]